MNDLNSDLGKIEKLLKIAKNREVFNKIILLSLIGVLTFGNLAIIYSKLTWNIFITIFK